MSQQDCEAFDHRLNCWIDANETDWSTILQDEHVKGCVRCQGSVQTWQKLDTVLASCQDQVASNLRSVPRVSGPRVSGTSGGWWVAVAASVLVIGSINRLPLERPVDPTMARISPVQQPVTKPITADEPRRPIISPVFAIVNSPGWMSHLPMPTVIERQWVDQTATGMVGLQSGMEPIGRTFRTVARLIAGESA